MTLRVIAPGLLTTVQDLGRPGWAHVGVSASGAADALSLRAGNLLVGNAENAAALEMTLAGGRFGVDRNCVVALTGAEFEASIPSWQAVSVRAGDEVRIGRARSGARAYLCVRGGLAVPSVLGSASTHLATRMGGYEGRALRAGDVLTLGDAEVRHPRPGAVSPPVSAGPLRVTRGLQADLFHEAAFYAAPYRVTEESSRMGLKLAGAALKADAGHMLTEGVTNGAIQAPPAGQPIILSVEHQTTGGYPKIANVIAADLWRVGQLRPRDNVQFEAMSLADAWTALQQQEEWLHGLV